MCTFYFESTLSQMMWRANANDAHNTFHHQTSTYMAFSILSSLLLLLLLLISIANYLNQLKIIPDFTRKIDFGQIVLSFCLNAIWNERRKGRLDRVPRDGKVILLIVSTKRISKRKNLTHLLRISWWINLVNKHIPQND